MGATVLVTTIVGECTACAIGSISTVGTMTIGAQPSTTKDVTVTTLRQRSSGFSECAQRICYADVNDYVNQAERARDVGSWPHYTWQLREQ